MTGWRIFLAAIPAAALMAGFTLPWLGYQDTQALVWGAATAIVLAALMIEIVTSLGKGDVGLDLVAALSMGSAILFGQNLAGVVVALMYAGGQLLESIAESRARSSMRELLARAPKRALRYRDGELSEVPIEALVPGDRVLVRQGDVIPADGVVFKGDALLDQAPITGESVPVRRHRGEAILSGATSIDMAFDMEVTRPAAESTYSGIVRMVEAAQSTKAPMVRLANRFAVWFLVATVIIAGAAWVVTDDPLRWLAVLVIATPCPLILAVPVAIISGMSRAARRGVLIKGGPVLETLARACVLVIDKTGTLTEGHATLSDVVVTGTHEANEVLRLAASLDQASNHVIAHSIVEAAHQRGLPLAEPHRVRETPGEGVEGTVDGSRVVVGGTSYVARKLKRKTIRKPHTEDAAVISAVGIHGKLAGFLVLKDQLREDAGKALSRLASAGIRRVVLASGDRQEVVESIAAALGIQAFRGELQPKDKIAIVQRERQNGVVLMAGDGVNDAPALAAADVGIAIGARGSPASAEAADAVLLTDRLERIAEAVEIAKRARGIALQSVYAGLGLSGLGMIAAAFGYLPPVQGAIAQEVIDVAVILNALRALR